MSTTYTGPLDLVTRGLDELAATSPEFRATGEKQEFLVGMSRLIARAERERLRVLAAAGDIAEDAGDRSIATWPATRPAMPTAPCAATRPWRGPWSHGGCRPPTPSRPVS